MQGNRSLIFTFIITNHMSHKLQIKGSIALIHAVSAFVIDWQKKNGKEDYDIKKDSFADQVMAAGPDNSTISDPFANPFAGSLVPPAISDPVQVQLPTATIEEPEKKKRASRAKPKEEPAAPVTPATPAPAAPDIALLDWLQNAAAPVSPAAMPWLGAAPAVTDPVIAGAPLSQADPFAPSAPTQPWSPEAVAQMPAPVAHNPVLSQIVSVMQYIGNEEPKRVLTNQYLASLGFSSVDQVPTERHAEVLNILTQIANGQIK